MLLLTSISLLLFRTSIQASPIPDGLNYFARSTLTTLDSACICPDSENKRSTLDIIWSCLATMFACTWVAVHPNIPSADEGWWMVTRRRLKLMFWAIIAPEMIIFWAMRQWFNARRIASKFKDRNWTSVHGFLLQMGGFVLYDGDERREPISFSKMQHLLDAGLIDFPDITVEEIKDRSKGDLLSKGIVTIQTSWFIVQCIARGIQGLVITELELVTVAFAVLNGVMYFFWWNKPLDVRCPFLVHLKQPIVLVYEECLESELKKSQVPANAENEGSCPTDCDLGGKHILETIAMPTVVHNYRLDTRDSDSQVGVDKTEIDSIDIIGLGKAKFENKNEDTEIRSTEVAGSAYETGDQESLPAAEALGAHPRWIASLYRIWDGMWYILIIRLIVDVLRPLDDMTQSPASITIEHGVDRVPTFYAELSPPKVLYGLDVPSSVIALVFGAIHCIGWSSGFQFPSHTERILWRTCALIITCVPVPFLVLAILLYKKVHWRPPGLGRSLFHLFKRFIYISLLLYIIARLALLTQAFVALRALPDGAHQTVEWTTFLPHI